MDRGATMAIAGAFRLAGVFFCAMLAAGPSWAQCVGDCDASGAVGIAELIRGVNIALGLAPLSQCPSFDTDGSGSVEIGELITAVNAALRGCPTMPTATPTPVGGSPVPTTPAGVQTPTPPEGGSTAMPLAPQIPMNPTPADLFRPGRNCSAGRRKRSHRSEIGDRIPRRAAGASSPRTCNPARPRARSRHAARRGGARAGPRSCRAGPVGSDDRGGRRSGAGRDAPRDRRHVRHGGQRWRIVIVSYAKEGFFPRGGASLRELAGIGRLRRRRRAGVARRARHVDIHLSSGQAQVARGSAMSDADGKRQATLLFPSGTGAEMAFPDGSRVPLQLLDVTLTEFTVGETGPLAMLAELPVESAYTYAPPRRMPDQAPRRAPRMSTSPSRCCSTSSKLPRSSGRHLVPLWAPSDRKKGNLHDLPLTCSAPSRSPACWVALRRSTATATGVADELLGMTTEERAQLAALGVSAGQDAVARGEPHFDDPWRYQPGLRAAGRCGAARSSLAQRGDQHRRRSPAAGLADRAPESDSAGTPAIRRHLPSSCTMPGAPCSRARRVGRGRGTAPAATRFLLVSSPSSSASASPGSTVSSFAPLPNQSCHHRAGST